MKELKEGLPYVQHIRLKD